MSEGVKRGRRLSQEAGGVGAGRRCVAAICFLRDKWVVPRELCLRPRGLRSWIGESAEIEAGVRWEEAPSLADTRQR